MYDNIGAKLKGFAIFTFVFLSIASLVGAIFLFCVDYGALGLLPLFLGPLFAWFISWFIYGYGELVENSQSTVYYARSINELMSSAPVNVAAVNSNINVAPPSSNAPSLDSLLSRGLISQEEYDNIKKNATK